MKEKKKQQRGIESVVQPGNCEAKDTGLRYSVKR